MLAIIFLLPIPLGANRPWAWSLFEGLIFLLTMALVIKNWRVEKLGIKSYISLVYIWLVFIGFCALQIIPLPSFVVALLSPSSFDLYHSVGADSFYLSIDHGQSTISFIKLLSFFCLSLCVLMLVNNEHRIKTLLLTIMIAGTVQALYGILEVLLGTSHSALFNLVVEQHATGTFVYKNHFANFLMLTLAAGIGLLVTSLEKSRINNRPKELLRFFANTMLSTTIIVRICIVIMVIGIVMSHSRMGNAAFFIATAVVGLLAISLIKHKSRGLSVLVLSIFIIDLFIVSAYFGLERVKERLEQTSFAQETRDEVIRDAYPIIADFPLFGSGAGSFYSTFPSYQVAEIGGFYDHLHNDYIQFLIEYGIVGGFLLFSIFAFCLYKALRALHKRRNSIFKGSAFACLMVFVGMGIHISVDFPLQGYANAAYFVVFISLGMIINSLQLHKVVDTRENFSNPPIRTRTRKRRSGKGRKKTRFGF